jgi:hypothetical protein
MKALISTTEVFTWRWISSWEWKPPSNGVPGRYVAVYSEIENCQRVAQVEPDNKTFPVHHTLIWVDCPDNCIADEWYFKDNVIIPKPQDELVPSTPVETLP